MSDTDSLREARKFVESTGNDELAERLDGRLADKQEAIQTIVELKNLVEQSESNGLGNDPAVEALREEAAALAEEHGLAESPSAEERLADGYGLDGGAVDRLHDDDRERLLANLQAVEEINDSDTAPSTSLAEHELAARREKVERLLDHNQVQAAALAGGNTDDAADSVSAFLAGLGQGD